MAKAVAAKNAKKAKKAPTVKASAKKQPSKASPSKSVAPAKKDRAKKVTPVKPAPSKKPASAKKNSPKPSAPKKATPKATPKPASAKKAPPKKQVAKKAPPAKSAAKAPAPPKPAPVKKKSTVTCPLSGFEVKPAKPNLAPSTIERLRLKLVEERARHVHQADEFQAEAEALANEREGGDTQFDEESGEGDTVNVARERDLLLSASARQIVDEIDRALERIKNKTYGVCAPAGRRISLERLEALPFAETCVECKARAERRR